MSVLWRFCQSLCKKDGGRKKVFLFLNTLLFGIIGLGLWMLLRIWTLNTWDWAIVFAGFPAYVFGFLGGVIFLYRV